ncbi:MAG: retroviral-like aspartic protease family protein, partial [Bacteroidia bacterium]|nr:retroviral-like aspartic protease family protein [Bacteroidia bacterium]
MGLVYAKITLINGDDAALFRRGKLQEEEIRQVEVKMLVDSGAYMMAINEVVKEQLGLFIVDKRKAQLADGSVREFDIAGPIEVRFANRKATCNAIVLKGDTEMLLGAIPMEEMDVLIHPQRNELVVNPDHPIMPQLPMK